MITTLYRKVIPFSLRKWIYDLFLGTILRRIRNITRKSKERKLADNIIKFYHSAPDRDKYPKEYIEAVNWIKSNGFNMFAGDYVFKYKGKRIKVYKCTAYGLRYVIHEGKKLYFPKKFSKKNCERYYIGLTEEQDIDSPHRYNYTCFNEDKDWIVLDLGAAEGIFALSVIEQAKKVYLFECEEQWMDALAMTFKPYSNKVEVINKYVSDADSDTTITINTFLETSPSANYYIKMDIEGAELPALQGSENIFSKANKVFLSVCTYHIEGVGQEIQKFLTGKGCKCKFTKGVMTYGEVPPFFRKGVIYARNYD